MNKLIKIVFFVLGVTLFSCKEAKIKSAEEFYKMLENPGNGFVKTREHRDIGFKLKYLPPEFFIVNETGIRKDGILSKKETDSLFSAYSETRSFLLTISTNGGNSDILYEGITSVEEYRERFELMNFNLGEYIYLKTEKNKYAPSLINLENVYGLSKSRKVNIVFSPVGNGDDLMTSEEYDLVFEDFIFNTGVNHFKFKKTETDKKLELKFH